MVASGNNIIIDDILLERFLDDYLAVFEPFDVTFVGVRCPIETINRREQSRPGRFPGTLMGTTSSVMPMASTMWMDTSAMSPRECAETVVQYQASHAPRVFKQLTAAYLGSAIPR